MMTENPEVLIVGTGASGLMKVLPEVERGVEAQGIKLIVEATDKACHTYNHVCHSQRAVAALHLTAETAVGRPRPCPLGQGGRGRDSARAIGCSRNDGLKGKAGRLNPASPCPRN
ncbi:hypothetical protein ES703_80724 [subsurface metagenome]